MKKVLFPVFSEATKQTGLMLLRMGLGFMFILHGYPKIVGGPERWEMLGNAMANLGITIFPVFWGFMAATTEFFGGFLLILGLLFRPATALLAFTMMVAALRHIVAGDPFIPRTSYPLELMIVFIAMFLAGPGKASLDSLIRSRSTIS